jgi:DNA invertase Pin-like site-specific DNA recombinase
MTRERSRQYAIYLRKSRKDKSLEENGIDTLERHEKALRELAQKQGLEIGEVYREVVSADSIEDREEMKRLLKDVHNNKWAGVLVFELERLARGDTKDQGIVAEAFKYSETLIITPIKTYDPNNETDETYFEFGLFMSRQEYKTIKRRLNAGVKLSVLEGNYLSPVAPYGYDIVDRGRRDRTLKPNNKAKIVQMMFRWYTVDKISFCEIAQKLTDMGIQSPKGLPYWTSYSVTKIIKNDIYIGKVRHGKNKDIKEYDQETGKLKTVCRKQKDEDVIIADGKHPALVDMETWNIAVSRHSRNTRIRKNAELSNPLAGLLRCSECGLMMQYKKTVRPTKTYEWFRHRSDYATNCNCNSADYKEVMDALTFALKEYVGDFEVKLKGTNEAEVNLHADMISEMEKNLESLKARRKKVLISYEDGLYTDEEFLERKNDINDDITMLSARIAEAYNTKPEEIDYREKVVKFSDAINKIQNGASPKEVNDFLKEILCDIRYSRPDRKEPFTLVLTLR